MILCAINSTRLTPPSLSFGWGSTVCSFLYYITSSSSSSSSTFLLIIIINVVDIIIVIFFFLIFFAISTAITWSDLAHLLSTYLHTDPPPSLQTLSMHDPPSTPTSITLTISINHTMTPHVYLHPRQPSSTYNYHHHHHLSTPFFHLPPSAIMLHHPHQSTIPPTPATPTTVTPTMHVAWQTTEVVISDSLLFRNTCTYDVLTMFICYSIRLVYCLCRVSLTISPFLLSFLPPPLAFYFLFFLIFTFYYLFLGVTPLYILFYCCYPGYSII